MNNIEIATATENELQIIRDDRATALGKIAQAINSEWLNAKIQIRTSEVFTAPKITSIELDSRILIQIGDSWTDSTASCFVPAYGENRDFCLTEDQFKTILAQARRILSAI